MVRAAAWCLVLGMCVLALGCGRSRRQAAAREESRLKPLAVLYGQFTGQNRGNPPANEDQFKAFLRSMDPERLAAFGVNDADELFISERDGKPYVVLYGAARGSSPTGPAGAPLIAYEQEGVGGNRYVASSIGAVEEVDESRFRELVPGASVP